MTAAADCGNQLCLKGRPATETDSWWLLPPSLQVLTGETEATEGTVWKHPNLRIAYVAQVRRGTWSPPRCRR